MVGRSYKGHGMTQTQIRTIEKESYQKARTGNTTEITEKESASIFQKIANEVLPDSVRMVVDTPGNHATGK